MADRRRIVTLSPGGRPILDIDLEVTATYWAIRDTFAYVPGQANSMTSREPGRYGGDQVVGEENDNGTVSWQALVRGTTPDQVATNVEALLRSGAKTTRTRLLEWRPDGSTYSSYFRIAGPITWKPTYKWTDWTSAQAMLVDIIVPARPLVLWDSMTIVDPFDVDSRGDYTFDAATSADVAIAAGVMTPVVGAALTAERRARHTVRGYKLLEGQVTRKFTPGATITGFKGGVTLRGSAPDTYVEVYVDDNGTNSRLRIDVVIAGVVTNRQTNNLAARVSNGTAFWIRGRIEDTAVIAEYFTSGPTPMGAPTLAPTGYTLTVGERTSLIAGYSGWTWVPQHAAATGGDFEFRPFTYRNQTLPVAIAPLDSIPGTAPALADVLITPSGGALAPAWAQVAWTKMLDTAATAPLFGLYEAEFATPLVGWASSAQAGAHSGNDARVTTAGAGTFSGTFTINFPAALEPDDFTDDSIDIEVWARVLVSSGNVNPRLQATIGTYSAAGQIGTQNTIEYGSVGKLITKPSAGTAYRIVRLGTFTLDASTTATTLQLLITGTVEAGSTGAFGLDYIWPAPARRRASDMTAVPLSSITPFAPSTGQWTKRIRSDLSATLSQPLSATVKAPGLGGALIQPSPGPSRVFVKLSTLVPDDPTVDATTEQLAHNATISLDVTPRSNLLRA